jgi:hypothetical protein
MHCFHPHSYNNRSHTLSPGFASASVLADTSKLPHLLTAFAGTPGSCCPTAAMASNNQHAQLLLTPTCHPGKVCSLHLWRYKLTKSCLYLQPNVSYTNPLNTCPHLWAALAGIPGSCYPAVAMASNTPHGTRAWDHMAAAAPDPAAAAPPCTLGTLCLARLCRRLLLYR